MSAGRLNRRELVVAGAGALAALALPAPLRARASLLNDLNVLGFGPELESVSDTSATFWWPTDAPADTTLRIGPAGGAKTSLTVEQNQTVHVARVDGLRPGAAYEYELVSAGKVMQPNIANPGSFTTLVPPKGERIARIAVMNDLHIGEHCAGTLQTVGSTSVPPCFTGDHYSVRMVSAAVREIRKADVDLVIANGDLSDRGRYDEIRTALAILKRTRKPLVYTRGNHDRLYDGCSEDRDCLKAAAFAGLPKGHHALTTEQDLGEKLTIVGLDSCDPESGHGDLNHNGQIELLEKALARAAQRGRRVLLCFHHPVTPAAITTALPPISFGIEWQLGGQALEAAVKGQDHLMLALHGHTHRNYVSYSKGCAAPFLEAGTIKEYPGSWTRLDVHTDGIMRTSHRVSEPYNRQWIKTTAGEYFGAAPSYLRGPLAARCFVHRYEGGQDVPVTVDGPLGAPALLG
jgi:predicted phosphodiesterase